MFNMLTNFSNRHTHDKVDQLFSRISVWLNNNDALTLPDLIDGIKKSYTDPVPEVLQLPFVINTQEFLLESSPAPHEVNNIAASHHFSVRKTMDKEGKERPGVFCKLYSDTEEVAPVFLLNDLPRHPPLTKPGRPLFHRHDSPDEAACARRFRAFREHLDKVMDMYEFSESQKQRWLQDVDWVDSLQVSDEAEYPDFWPLDKQDVTDWLQNLREPTPAGSSSSQEQSLTRRPNINRPLPLRPSEELLAVARRLAEIEERIADKFSYQGIVLSGAARTDDSGHLAYMDARAGNLVLMDVRSADWSEVPPESLLGDWERTICVGYVRKRIMKPGAGRKADPEELELAICEPWHEDASGPVCPLWVHRDKCLLAGVPPPPTTWEAVQNLTWRDVKALPLSVYDSFYKSAFTNTRRETHDDDFMGLGVPAKVNFHLQKANFNQHTLIQKQAYSCLQYTCQLTGGKEEREAGVRLPRDALECVALSLERETLLQLQKEIEARAD